MAVPHCRIACVLALMLCAMGSPIVSAQENAGTLPDMSVYTSEAMLSPDFRFFWMVNTSSETIHIAARARTSGWLAFGISEIGSMIGSDAMVGWVADDTVFATDRFIFDKSGGPSGIPLDAQQDWKLAGGQELFNESSSDTWTEIHVWRKLFTGDCNDREIVAGQTVNLIWAFGTTDTLSYHGATRGAMSLVLVPDNGTSILLPPSPPSDVSAAAGAASAGSSSPSSTLLSVGLVKAWPQQRFLNLTFSSHHVSTNETTYMCKVFDLPPTTSAHVIEFGAHINSTRPSAVHHAVLYGCRPDEYASIPNTAPAGTPFDCLHFIPCETTVAMWAVGGRPFKYPEGVGYPIGGAGHFRKVVLQMHFTNPEGRADIVDNSGLYLKLAGGTGSSGSSSKGGKIVDAAIMLVGPVDYSTMIQIPPGMPSWTQTNTCPGVCTEAVFKNESVNIIGSILHLHTLGRQLYTDVYRGGKKLRSINRLDYYDFSSQQTVPIRPAFELLPGDELRTTCVWNSSARTNVTMGGPATHDEMCIDYLIYYPAHPGNEMNACMDFCAAMDANNSLVFDPARPDLRTFYVCGTGQNRLIPSDKKCSIGFGENLPVQVTHGCPTETKASVSAFPPRQLSMPAALTQSTGRPNASTGTTVPKGSCSAAPNAGAVWGTLSAVAVSLAAMAAL